MKNTTHNNLILRVNLFLPKYDTYTFSHLRPPRIYDYQEKMSTITIYKNYLSPALKNTTALQNLLSASIYSDIRIVSFFVLQYEQQELTK